MTEAVILGLTGPTGAGKSTVARILLEQGCAVIDCDRVARETVEHCAPCLEQLKTEFGNDIVGADGKLDRRLLAQRAFSSASKTKRLNEITHPWILKAVDDEIAVLKRGGGAFCIVVDAPLLFESGADAICDRILAVVAPLGVRLTRIVRRDGISREQALSRIRAQQKDSFYTERSDYSIDGTAPLEQLEKELAAVLHQITGGVNENKS